MLEIPEEVFKLLNNDKATKVVATKTPKGEVHAIVVGSVSAPDPNTITFGTLVMKRTSQNLRWMKEKGELATVLVAWKTISFEVRCRIRRQSKKGKELERMNEQLKPMGLKMTSVWYLEPMEIWDQSASYQAGTRVV